MLGPTCSRGRFQLWLSALTALAIGRYTMRAEGQQCDRSPAACRPPTSDKMLNRICIADGKLNLVNIVPQSQKGKPCWSPTPGCQILVNFQQRSFMSDLTQALIDTRPTIRVRPLLVVVKLATRYSPPVWKAPYRATITEYSVYGIYHSQQGL